MENQNTNESSYPDGIRLLRILYKWYKLILLVTFFAVAAALLFSSPWFMPPYYKAEVIFYPPGTNSNKILIEKDPRFGSDKEIDEQIQIMKSSVVRDSIITRYNLITHYKTDTSEMEWTYWFYKQLEDNITIERTRYNSISVKVYDINPVLAAAIANDMVRIGDAVKSYIIKGNLQKAYQSFSKEYFEKSRELDVVITTLNKFIDNPISTYVTRKDKTYPEALKEQLEIQSAIEKAKSGGRLSDMEALYKYQLLLQQMNEIQSSYFQAFVNLNSNIPSCYVITPAEASYKKAGPKRLLIMMVTLFAALTVSSVAAVFLERMALIRRMVTEHQA